MGSKTTPLQYAGFVSRSLAFVIDLITIAVISFLVTVVIGLIADFFNLNLMSITFGEANQVSMTPLQAAVALVGSLFSALFSLVYFLFFWVLIGFTPGMALMGIRITRCDGQRVGLGRAIVRYLGYWVSLIFLSLGFIWVLFDRRRQGWHDKLADTCVVYFDKDFSLLRK